MSFKTQREIYEHLLKGGKVRDTCDDIADVFLTEKGDLNFKDTNFQFPRDWEPFEEPKKKVKLYKYAWKSFTGSWEESGFYYRDDLAARKVTRSQLDAKVIRLDYTMIEVDEE